MTESTTRELAIQLAGRLMERRDTKAMQKSDGAWFPVRDKATQTAVPFKVSDVQDHLNGTFTYGHYVVSSDNTCRMFAFDIDLDATGYWESTEARTAHRDFVRQVWNEPITNAKKQLALELRVMSAALAYQVQQTLGISPLVTYSGCKGMHVLVPIDPGTPAESARVLAQAVLDGLGNFKLTRGSNFFEHSSTQNLSIEVFPKQDEVRDGDGLGNLMRLPLGIHRKSGKPGFFIKMTPNLEVTELDDPYLAITQGSLR